MTAIKFIYLLNLFYGLNVCPSNFKVIFIYPKTNSPLLKWTLNDILSQLLFSVSSGSFVQILILKVKLLKITQSMSSSFRGYSPLGLVVIYFFIGKLDEAILVGILW